ncbi:glycoside hydrolase family 2 TIM barrel-domain containing protein [Anaerosporobacter sp.]|uniref:glycoside hydrolase family 2 TIM barrel-domain containing protein n=1 Tax=Anaerosporobacter sp. TaxID=1872529 RepID=UPI00286F8304|nr:glycoside hydrolase family 2 TIM barrel-domain containing protein [Anaerosporobacter sp.]
MKADINWLDDPEVFRVNQLAAHSDHFYYKDWKEMEGKNNSLQQSLNGTWRFCYSRNAKERPTDFYQVDFCDSNFDTIAVPGHIELSGYDKLHYINTMYPWEGHEYRRPKGLLDNHKEGTGLFSTADYNPVGSYRKTFDLEEGLIGKRVCIFFAGVEQAIYVWLNGEFLGYAEDSFTPSEFDLTPYIKEKGNVLAVEVHKRCSAAYLEDQDFFRFFGIYRNVILYAKPAIHVDDLWMKSLLKEDNKTGVLTVDLNISSEVQLGSVKAILMNEDGVEVFSDTSELQYKTTIGPVEIEDVTPWDNHVPYLYTLMIEVYDSNNTLTEVIPYRTGFRRIEIKDKKILLNGERLIINGVNRHEWDAKRGRSITMTDMEWDINCFKENNINAVRTCHYPDQLPWYYLCDENGIYMMAETNLESHGSWQKLGQIDPSWNVPGKSPLWKAAVLDRAKTNFEVFKNHTSILFWSLGNESYAEENIVAMNAFFKEKDPDRLVHYEGVVNNPALKDRISDMESHMYTSPENVAKYLENNPEKPFLLCEYMHCMGNSLGGFQSYSNLIDKYEMYHGGFIWDFIDQALLVKDEVTGEEVLRYGGDFDDRPSDYEFSGNGIVFADRTLKPAMQEVRYCYGLHK